MRHVSWLSTQTCTWGGSNRFSLVLMTKRNRPSMTTVGILGFWNSGYQVVTLRTSVLQGVSGLSPGAAAPAGLPVLLGTGEAAGLAGDGPAGATPALAEVFLPLTLLLSVPASVCPAFGGLAPGLIVFLAVFIWGLGTLGPGREWFLWSRFGLGLTGFLPRAFRCPWPPPGFPWQRKGVLKCNSFRSMCGGRLLESCHLRGRQRESNNFAIVLTPAPLPTPTPSSYHLPGVFDSPAILELPAYAQLSRRA